MQNIEDCTIAIYVIVDDILKNLGHKEHKLRQVNDSMILTTAMIASLYFGSNYSKAIGYMKAHHCKEMLSESRFNRRLTSAESLLEHLFFVLAEVYKSQNPLDIYLLDTFPVSVCHNIRIGRCRLLKGEQFRGKNTSKRVYFYGFKVAMIITETGWPVEFSLIPASFAEQSALKGLQFNLSSGSRVIGDAGFKDYTFEDNLAHYDQIQLLACRNKGSLRADNLVVKTMKEVSRKFVETTFSLITKLFPKSIHAVTIKGFSIKIALFNIAFSMHQFFCN